MRLDGGVPLWHLPGVARKLRIQYAGVAYHVINRGDRCEAYHPGNPCHQKRIPPLSSLPSASRSACGVKAELRSALQDASRAGHMTIAPTGLGARARQRRFQERESSTKVEYALSPVLVTFALAGMRYDEHS
jgi:hypothetical protein